MLLLWPLRNRYPSYLLEHLVSVVCKDWFSLLVIFIPILWLFSCFSPFSFHKWNGRPSNQLTHLFCALNPITYQFSKFNLFEPVRLGGWAAIGGNWTRNELALCDWADAALRVSALLCSALVCVRVSVYVVWPGLNWPGGVVCCQ